MTKSVSLLIFALVAFLIAATAASGQMTVTGKVVEVLDGKTVVIAVATGKVKAELQYIDIPAENQQLHDTIKDHLSRLVLGKIVEYRAKTLLSDRTVGRLLLNDTDVSLQMLRDGAAWHIPSSISGQEKSEVDTYALTEQDARNEKRGVWSVPGLKPSWETVAEKQVFRNRIGPTPVAVPPEDPVAKNAAKRGYWSDKNPTLGDVGALANGYNAETKSGYVGTSFMGVTELDPSKIGEAKTAVDITYFYKEIDKNKRHGRFVVTVISESGKWRFLEHNDLVIICDDKKTVVGKPKRAASNTGDTFQENLTYQINRASLDKIVNGNDVVMKVGDYMIKPAAGLQMLLYNLLQISE